MELAGSFLPALLLCSLFDARDFAKITYLVRTRRQKKGKTYDLFFYFNAGLLKRLTSESLVGYLVEFLLNATFFFVFFKQ